MFFLMSNMMIRTTSKVIQDALDAVDIDGVLAKGPNGVTGSGLVERIVHRAKFQTLADGLKRQRDAARGFLRTLADPAERVLQSQLIADLELRLAIELEADRQFA